MKMFSWTFSHLRMFFPCASSIYFTFAIFSRLFHRNLSTLECEKCPMFAFNVGDQCLEPVRKGPRKIGIVSIIDGVQCDSDKSYSYCKTVGWEAIPRIDVAMVHLFRINLLSAPKPIFGVRNSFRKMFCHSNESARKKLATRNEGNRIKQMDMNSECDDEL